MIRAPLICACVPLPQPRTVSLNHISRYPPSSASLLSPLSPAEALCIVVERGSLSNLRKSTAQTSTVVISSRNCFPLQLSISRLFLEELRTNLELTIVCTSDAVCGYVGAFSETPFAACNCSNWFAFQRQFSAMSNFNFTITWLHNRRQKDVNDGNSEETTKQNDLLTQTKKKSK